ncbi:cytochrome P450, cyclodipeptide synthase-associated [Streptomyces sp. A30]|uniref:cytochrome P450, cyclodipeptide synthase-associated n=1 Tax=Streptomyces sp. A30 TaxID=2789273 RepID=UPI00397F6162
MTGGLPRVRILSEEFTDAPYGRFAALRQESPVHYDPEVDCYFVSRHHDVRRVLTDHATFTSEPLQVRAEPVMRGPVLAQMTGAEHSAKRKMVVRGLTGASLDRHVREIRANAEELLRPFMDTGRVDLVNDFGKPFAIRSTLDVLGLDKGDWRRISGWHRAIAEFIGSIAMSRERRHHSLECSAALEAYLLPVIEERRARPGDDLISHVCARDADSAAMSTREVTALVINILVAAAEPVDKTLALLFRHLIEHPEQLAQVRKDPRLLRNAIAETLRLTPPVQIIPRQAVTAADVSGITIPADATVFCLIGSANRDPAAFASPDAFDLHRGDLGAARSFTAAAQHLAFGAGLHMCVGAAFSRMQIETVADLLLQRMSAIRLPTDFGYRETGLYLRGPEALPLEFTPRPEPSRNLSGAARGRSSPTPSPGIRPSTEEGPPWP